MKREIELVGTGVILPISRGTLLDVTRRFLHYKDGKIIDVTEIEPFTC